MTGSISSAVVFSVLALTAIKQGDLTIGKQLLRDSIDTHPQYFEAARHLSENPATSG